MWNRLLGTSRARRCVSSLVLSVTIAVSTFPGLAFAQTGSIDGPLRQGFWVAVQVIGEVSLNSNTGQRFTPDAQFLDQLTTTEPHAAISSGAEVSMLEAFSPAEAVVEDSPNFSGDAATSQAEAIIAELELARLLNDGSWLGAPGSKSGADGRVRGSLLVTAAKAQADFALINLRTEDGSFIDTTAGPTSGGNDEGSLANPRMLEALSQLTYTIDPEGPFGDVYGDARFAPWFREGAHSAFSNLPASGESSISQNAASIEGLVWYLEILDDSDVPAVSADLKERADSILTALNDRATGPTGTANAVEALSLAASALDEPTYLAAAADLMDDLGVEIDRSGVEWTIGDIAAVIGALNSFTAASEEGTADHALSALAELVHGAVLSSGLVLALNDPAEVLKDLGVDGDSLDDLDMDLSVAPTGSPALAAHAGVEGGSWVAASEPGDPVSAMYLARRLLEAGSRSQGALVSSTAVSEDADTVASVDANVTIEIESRDFGFSPPSIDVPTGATVTLRLINLGVVPHNINIPELGVFVEAEAGATEEVTFTTPDVATTADFLCSVPGHPESGMTGEITVIPIEVTSTSIAPTDDAQVAASSSLIPPLTSGSSEPGFGLGGLVVPFLGLLFLMLIASSWALWHLTLALDDGPAPSRRTRPSPTNARQA